jgi:cysteine sulfinate desulfinase/cysteine desulfurase-like protein
MLPSPVLKAMNVPETVLTSAMRFSFSHLLSDEEIMTAGRQIARAALEVRSLKVEV